MKRIIAIMLLLILQTAFCKLQCYSQSIDSIEYFFDSDPGHGNANKYSVTLSDSITDSISFNLTGLSTGFHNLFFRVRSVNGTWSFYEGRSFFIQDTLTSASASFDSSSAEYFYDTDPGVGKGTSLSLAPGDSILDTAFASTSGLSPGFHNLYCRIKDSNNVWSLYDGGSFYLIDTISASSPPASHPIEAAEYFFDTDPGVGNAIAMSSFSAADSILLSDTLPAAPLTIGSHNLFIRVRDTLNVWSLYEGKLFVVCNLVPIPDFSADTVCAKTPTTFTDLSTNLDTAFNYTYGWDFNNDNIIDDTTKGNTIHTFNSPGTHTVSLLVNNTNGCLKTIIKTVYVDSLPTATFSLPVDTICKNDTLTLSGGIPAGGVYSGSGVYGGAFYGDSVSTGKHTLFYTFYNSDSCSVKVSDVLYISHCTGINNYNASGFSVSVTPNPFHSSTVLNIQNPKNDYRDQQFILFDVFGKELRRLEFDSQNLRFERGNIPSGIYLYKVLDKEGNYFSGKLVVLN